MYTVRNVTKAWLALAPAAGIRPFSRMVSSHVTFNRTGIIFEILSIKTDGYDPTLQDNALAEVIGLVSAKVEVAAEVRNKAADVDEAQRNVAYLYLEHDTAKFMFNALNTGLTNWEKSILYVQQVLKFPKMLQSLSDSVVAALGIMVPESLTTAFVERDKQGRS